MVDLKNISKYDFGQYFEYQHSTYTDTDDYIAACKKAMEYNCRVIFGSRFCVDEQLDVLKGSNTMLGTGISFPLGSDPTFLKVAAAEEYVKRGFQVLDCVTNIHAVKLHKWDYLKDELKALREVTSDIELKIIMEVCHYDHYEIQHLCELIAETGIDFAKTATGRAAGPQMDQIEVMVNTLKDTPVRIKVAGIKDPRPQNAIAYLKAGADVLGSQKVFDIIDSLDLMKRMNQI